MQAVKWTERKFLFGYDKGYVPFFVERLRGTAARIEELVTGCNEEFASTANGTEWSVKEHIGHLTDLETLHDGRIDDFINGKEILRPADMTNKATYDAGHNSKSLQELILAFKHTRNNYLARLESLDENHFDRKAMHPRLQQMITLTDLLYFVAEHDNNHLTKMAQLLAKTS